MTLYKTTTYPFSFSLTEPEFRLAIQGAYDSVHLTYKGNEHVETVRTLRMDKIFPGVQKSKMRMTKPCFGMAAKPYWVVRF